MFVFLKIEFSAAALVHSYRVVHYHSDNIPLFILHHAVQYGMGKAEVRGMDHNILDVFLRIRILSRSNQGKFLLYLPSFFYGVSVLLTKSRVGKSCALHSML